MNKCHDCINFQRITVEDSYSDKSGEHFNSEKDIYSCIVNPKFDSRIISSIKYCNKFREEEEVKEVTVRTGRLYSRGIGC